MINGCSRGVLGLLAVTLLCWQSSYPLFAQTATQPAFALQGPGESTGSPVVRDALNRPCLDVEAASRAHIVNQALYDQIVSVKNRCGKLIKVKVCYFNSDNCKTADVGGYQRQDLILGMVVNGISFKYFIIQK